MCWFSMLSRTYNRGSAGGQLDTMLKSFYDQDSEKGVLSDDEAVFYLACMFLQDSRYFQLGGPDENGEDITNKLSYLALEAADKINIACNLTVRVHDKMDEAFFKNPSNIFLRTNRAGRGIRPTTRSSKGLCGADIRKSLPEGVLPPAVTGCAFPEWNTR